MRPTRIFRPPSDRFQRCVIVGFSPDRLHVHIGLLYARRIDPVVFGMRADEPHEADAMPIVEPYDQSVPVAADIEHNPVVPDDAGIAIVGFDIRGRKPVGLGRNGMP